MAQGKKEGGVRNSGGEKERDRYKDRRTAMQDRQGEKLKTFKSQYAIWHGHWTTTV